LDANASSRFAIVNRIDEVANLANVNLSINKEDSFINNLKKEFKLNKY
jgi:hypothetical protein